MMKCFRFFRLVFIIFAVMILINTAAMYLLFGISVLPWSLGREIHFGSDNAEVGSGTAELLGESGTAGWATVGTPPEDGKQAVGQTSRRPASPGDRNSSTTTNGTGVSGNTSGQDRDEAYPQPDGGELILTRDDIDHLIKMSLKDKMTVMAILSRMDRDEVNRILTMSMDGITQEEYQDIVLTAEKHLETAEMEDLKEMVGRDRNMFAEKER